MIDATNLLKALRELTHHARPGWNRQVAAINVITAIDEYIDKRLSHHKACCSILKKVEVTPMGVHKARCMLLEDLHCEYENIGSGRREEIKLRSEIQSAEMFLKTAKIRLKALQGSAAPEKI